MSFNLSVDIAFKVSIMLSKSALLAMSFFKSFFRFGSVEAPLDSSCPHVRYRLLYNYCNVSVTIMTFNILAKLC